MPTIETKVSCPVTASFRVHQVAGMFDVPLTERSQERFAVEVPDLNEQWTIGAIVGPSASGKTTIARAAFGDAVYKPGQWPTDRAIVDGFGDHSAREIAHTMTAVGLSSPPSWIKPYHVLSCGEKFRCDLARALIQNAEQSDAEVPGSPCVFDEFTSVVDRNIAKISSAAVAKAIRSGRIDCRFVAVTCHYDVLDWLEPDWVVDMATCQLQRGRLWRRPPIKLEIYRTGYQTWSTFARHHYLSGQLSRSARCFVAWWRDVAVAFCATLPVIGRRAHWRITRAVTLPDYQGVGIGSRLAEAVAELHRAEGHRLSITASHPALLAHCRTSPLWRATGVKRTGASRTGKRIERYRTSLGRAVASFEYVGKAGVDPASPPGSAPIAASPKGLPKKAQGRAERRPGYSVPTKSKALKGRNKKQSNVITTDVLDGKGGYRPSTASTANPKRRRKSP